MKALLALLLLLPIESACPEIAPPEAWAALKQLDKDLDLWHAETGFMPSFRQEVCWTRATWWELQGAPPSTDLDLFPPHEVCKNWTTFQTRYLETLEMRALLSPHAGAAIFEAAWYTREAMAAWRAAEYARQPGLDTVNRRRTLRELRDLLGPHDYYAGRMPDPVPLWAFNAE